MNSPFKRNAKVQRQKKHIGEIRQSQLLSTFGIGSIVDFVSGTAMIGGIDGWDKDSDWENRKIYNENLQFMTGTEFFLTPKTSEGKNYLAVNQDIVAYSFPRKLYCPVCKSIIDIKEVENQKDIYKCNQYLKDNKPCKGKLVHSRFILVCENGHVDDFPYSWWVHNGEECSSGKVSPRIKMYNVGGRSDTESLWLECTDCGKKRSMSYIFGNNIFSGENGRSCSGIHPHLNFFKEECDAIPRTRLRSSSGVYFPVIYSAILIPPWTQKAFNVIKKNYDQLSYMSNEKRAEYIKDKIAPKYPNLNIQDFLTAYDKVEASNKATAKRSLADVFFDEYNVLCKSSISDDRFSSHLVDVPEDFTNIFDTVTVIDKLVVTQAMAGFTRLTDDEKHIVPLARNNGKKRKWLPAIELNGEGIFIKFNKTAVDKWVIKNGARYNKMETSHKNSNFQTPKYSPQYVMLHTFAHLLIRQISNECGYSTASISEKIYSTFTDGENNEEMMGILIYLSTSDSDGSLGGLVSVANNTVLLDNVLKNMLREAKWCSGDPICSLSEHQGYNSLNYAACHACTLLPETSCEFKNLLLDRISIVGKPDDPDLGIMGFLASNL